MYTITLSHSIWLQLRVEEQRLLQELATLQEAEFSTKKGIAEQRTEHERLDGEEERYLREYARHRRDQLLTEDEVIRSAEMNKEKYIYILNFWNSLPLPPRIASEMYILGLQCLYLLWA
jgi:hypothetical protein